MTDRITVEERSKLMAKIHGRDTGPEMIVRKFLFAKGLRFRVNAKYLPGHPDIVLAKHNAIVEVMGCFWHRHKGCKTATMPKSNIDFWQEKFKRNVERDARHEKIWTDMGWRLFVVWECELEPSHRLSTLERLYAAITQGEPHEYETPLPDEIPAVAEPKVEYEV